MVIMAGWQTVLVMVNWQAVKAKEIANPIYLVSSSEKAQALLKIKE